MALAILICALPLVLAGAKSANREVRCEIVVIHASDGKGGFYVDPTLAPLAEHLRSSFGSRFTSFRHLSTTGVSLGQNTRKPIALPNEQTLALTLKKFEGEYLHVFMELAGLRTTVRIRDGGLFFQAGHGYKNGMLVLAITLKRT